MKRIIGVLGLSMMFCFCGKKETKNTETATEITNDYSVTAVVEADVVAQILAPYLSLKNAFVSSVVDSVRKATLKLQTQVDRAIDQTDQAELKAQLTNLLAKIAADSDINAQRVQFEGVSKIVYAMVKNSQATAKFGIYKQFCPMAFDNAGAFWLSQKEAILNPYFGAKMLNCGVVQEEL